MGSHRGGGILKNERNLLLRGIIGLVPLVLARPQCVGIVPVGLHVDRDGFELLVDPVGILDADEVVEGGGSLGCHTSAEHLDCPDAEHVLDGINRHFKLLQAIEVGALKIDSPETGPQQNPLVSECIAGVPED